MKIELHNTKVLFVLCKMSTAAATEIQTLTLEWLKQKPSQDEYYDLSLVSAGGETIFEIYGNIEDVRIQQIKDSDMYQFSFNVKHDRYFVASVWFLSSSPFEKITNFYTDGENYKSLMCLYRESLNTITAAKIAEPIKNLGMHYVNIADGMKMFIAPAAAAEATICAMKRAGADDDN